MFTVLTPSLHISPYESARQGYFIGGIIIYFLDGEGGWLIVEGKDS